jgi:hypothetical protein
MDACECVLFTLRASFMDYYPFCIPAIAKTLVSLLQNCDGPIINSLCMVYSNRMTATAGFLINALIKQEYSITVLL